MAVWHSGLLRDPRASMTAGSGTALVSDWRAHLAEWAQRTRDARLRRFCEAGCVDAHTPISDVPLLAMDVETTGLNPATDGIVSIGVVPLRLDRILTSQGRQWLLKPRVPLGEDAIALHGITHQQLAGAPDLDDILDDLLGWMAGHVMVVHCRDIERLFMNSALQRRLGEDIAFPVIDTMALEARLHRKPRPWWMRWRQSSAPAPSIRLAASRERYGLPRYRLHHAFTDALATAELFHAQVAHHHTPDTPVGALWC